MKKIILATCMAALLAAPAMAQVDFSRYVSMGDSLAAGIASGSLMDYYQSRSYPALLAQQGGTGTFEMPLIAEPGLEPALVLQSLSPLSVGPTDVMPPADPLEYFYNASLEAPYQNVAVPTHNTYDMLFATGNIFNLIGGNLDNVVNDLILRTPQVEDPSSGELIDYTALVAGLSQQPTFVTVWIGSNDVLGAMTTATAVDGVTMTPVAAFTQYYSQAIGALATSLPNSQIVVFTIFGDVTWVPFASAVPTSVDVPGLGTLALIGEDGELTDGDYLTLGASSLLAQGWGLPIPDSPPLPENLDLVTGSPGVILRADEIAVINERLATINQIINDTAALFPNVRVFDINDVFEALATGTYRSFGGIELSAEYLLGGIFSYDGIHPHNVGHGVLAYELINFLNTELGAGLDQLNMTAVLNEGGWDTGSGSALACVACNAKEVVMTSEAFMQVYEIFAPELAERYRRHQQRGASTTVD
jgi:lysophospholipase L1-like esterase